MFLDFDPDASTDEVPDPYYGGAAGFTEVVQMVRAAARGLIAALQR
jgi:protein-tyrosine phosphatase